jgi:hypothetical protein
MIAALKKSKRPTMSAALAICAMLSSGCSLFPRTETIPDPSIPHRIADESEAVIWVRRPDGTLTRETVRVLPGWWLASPQVVER